MKRVDHEGTENSEKSNARCKMKIAKVKMEDE